MINCPNCQTPLEQNGEEEFIVKCSNCSRFNRFIFEECEEEGRKTIKNRGEILHKKKIGDGVLYTYRFEEYHLLKRIMPKTGEALEKFLLEDKKSLFPEEKNILYKLKAESISDIETKINYLEVKVKSIKILELLDF